MHYLIYPTKDATLYKDTSRVSQNTGLDELLEVQKYVDGENTTHISRALLKFDTTDISASLVSGDITNPSYYLNLRLVDATELPIDYTIYAYPVSESWDMGQGTYSDSPIDTVGVSWKYRDSLSTGTAWASTGSEYYTDNSGSELFSYREADVRMDITSIVEGWMSGSLNEGIVIKHSDAYENDVNSYGRLQFFSKETNTIYSPTLETVWDDHIFSTGSIEALTGLNKIISLTNMQRTYKMNSRVQLRVRGRIEFPEKSFTVTNPYLVNNYLPETTYYSIIDVEHNNVIIPFDSGTQLSLDSSGNYFNLWMDSFQPERFYTVQFKVVDSGTETYYNSNQIFKVVR